MQKNMSKNNKPCRRILSIDPNENARSLKIMLRKHQSERRHKIRKSDHFLRVDFRVGETVVPLDPFFAVARVEGVTVGTFD